MLFCDACDKGYHMDCHKPQVLEKPSGKWICCECSSQGITTAHIETLTIPDLKPEVSHLELPNTTHFLRIWRPDRMPATIPTPPDGQ